MKKAGLTLLTILVLFIAVIEISDHSDELLTFLPDPAETTAAEKEPTAAAESAPTDLTDEVKK